MQRRDITTEAVTRQVEAMGCDVFEVGVFDALLESLAEMVERDPSADMIDSTIVRAHHCAVGIKRGLSKQRRLVDRVAALPPNSMPAAMPKAARSASS